MEESSGVLQCLKRSGFLRWATVSLVFNICSVATLMQLAEARWSYAAFTSSCLNAYPEIAQPSSIRPHHRTRPTSHLPSIATLVECSLYVTSALRHKCLTRWGTQRLPWHGRFTYTLHYLLFLLGLVHANTEAEIKSTPPMLFSTATTQSYLPSTGGRGVPGGLQESAESQRFRLDWASHTFQAWLRLGRALLTFHSREFFLINLNILIGYSIISRALKKCVFYDGIKKQKLEVHFNVLALTFSKVILNCVCVCVCVKTVTKMQNNSREVKGHSLKKEI